MIHVYQLVYVLYDIIMIPNWTSGKDVYILAKDTLNRGSGTVDPINLV